MLTPLEIRSALRCLTDGTAIGVLAELEAGRVYEAERLAMGELDTDRAHELIASLVRGTAR